MLTVEGAMNTNRHEFFQFLAANAVLTPAARAEAQQIAPLMSVQDALWVMD